MVSICGYHSTVYSTVNPAGRSGELRRQSSAHRVSAAERLTIPLTVNSSQNAMEHRPWVWKDPRLWLTIYFWKSLLSLDQCRFILLTVIWIRLGYQASFSVSWRGPWACCLDTLSRPFPSCSAGLRGFCETCGFARMHNCEPPRI